jgi:hypothetical protein
MPTDNDPAPGQPQGKGDLLRSIGLLAVPLLAFQRNMLGIALAGIDKASALKPVQTLAQCELQALMMILDPNGAWRNSLGTDIEEEMKATLDAAVPKVISGSVMLIDAQQELLNSLIAVLDKARTRKASQE